jgi:hypothetical protein
MKSILTIISISSIILLTSCSSYTINTYGTSEDDLYYSKNDARTRTPIYHEEIKVQDMSGANTSNYADQDQQNNSVNYSSYTPSNDAYNNSQNPNYSQPSQESGVDENGRTIVNNYYGDVYEDDGGIYSTRIQRFHRPFGGFGYYSPAYCGFYNDPFWNPGWNIGLGFNNGFGPGWNMGWGIGMGWGMGWGNGFYDPFFDPWFNPFFSPYYGFGGWGNNPYNWGYRDGYWDGRNDNGNWNGGFGRGGSRNTVIRGPRPSRGGTVSTAGGRTVPSREASPNSTSGTENIRALPPSRNLPSNVAPANNASESRPIPNTTPNGYVPPRLPNNTSMPIRSTDDVPTRTTSPVRVASPSANPAPVRVNPNFSGTRENSNSRETSRPAPIRVQPTPRRSESSQPRYNAPSRSSSPSPAPSRSSSGGNSAPASRPRPR